MHIPTETFSALLPGGGPFNTAIALARLGAPACFLGALSRDAFGQLLDRTLTSAGVATEYVTRVAAPTPLALVSLSADEPSFSFYLRGTAHEAFDPSAGGNLDSTVVALHIGLARSGDRSAWIGGRRVRRARVCEPTPRDRPEHQACRDRRSRRLSEEVRTSSRSGGTAEDEPFRSGLALPRLGAWTARVSTCSGSAPPASS